jgi:hypothetical protein
MTRQKPLLDENRGLLFGGKNHQLMQGRKVRPECGPDRLENLKPSGFDSLAYTSPAHLINRFHRQ